MSTITRLGCNARARGVLLLFLAFAFGLACGPAGESESSDGDSVMLQEVGRDLFLRHCSACHGASGRGDGPAALALTTQPADLTRISERRDGQFPRAELALIIDGRVEVVAHGTREMPVWGVQFAQELNDESLGEEWARGHIGVLLDYLATLQR